MRSGKKVVVFTALALAAILAWGCSGGGDTDVYATAAAAGDGDLLAVETGRLVDVYGLDNKNNRVSPTGLHDCLVGTNIVDGTAKVPRIRSFDPSRPGATSFDVTFTFEGVDAETGQEKMVIELPLYSDASQDGGMPTHPEFLDALDYLDNEVKDLGKGYYGQDITTRPFAVAPRNGAIRLTFSRDLGLPPDYFVARDAKGQVTGQLHTRAVQLLEITGDPTDGDIQGDFRTIPARIVDKGRELIIDPVILGSEGPDLGIPNNAEGMPESLNTRGANIRVALPMEGAIRVAGLREKNPILVGVDSFGKEALIRDFRSANKEDRGPMIANGFINDPIPPRIVGESLIHLLDVEPDPNSSNPRYRILRLYQGAMKHTKKYAPYDDKIYSPVEIETFDVIKQKVLQEDLVIRAEVIDVVEQEVLGSDPLYPGQIRVEYRVRAKMLGSLDFELNRDAQGKPLPTDVVQVSTYESVRQVDTGSGSFKAMPKDDPRYFLTFSPAAPDARYPTDNISPFASALVRFTKPVDMETISSFDTMMLSILKTEENEEIQETVLDPVEGTPGLVVSRIFDEDGAQRVIRSQPPMGFYHDKGTKGPWDPSLYRAGQGNPPDLSDLYYLYLLTGKEGVKDLAGNPIELSQGMKEWFMVDFTIKADAPTNRVVNIARRWMTADEDPYHVDQSTIYQGDNVQDWFGACVLLSGGRVMPRPATRSSSYVDGLNQMSEPRDPAKPELRFCRHPAEIFTPTAATKFGAPIQNPINPLGCRLQTCWREIDLSLSRTNPFDFNLDVEQMHWAPFQALQISYDIFDKISLYLDHAEFRPSACRSASGFTPVYPRSGLGREGTTQLFGPFRNNYLDGDEAGRTAAYEARKMVVQSALATLDPKGQIHYLQLPPFNTPYFTYRDERDLGLGGGQTERVISPWLSARGGTSNYASFNGQPDNGLPTIALPLLADFWFYPDNAVLNGPANGYNGWQISLTVFNSPLPNFRVYSGGGYKPPGQTSNPPGQKDIIDPSTETKPKGGYVPTTGQRTRAGDNTVYWARFDFLRRISVMTYGFLDIRNPNKCADPSNNQITDPRLVGLPPTARMNGFDMLFEPPLAKLPQGTRVLPQFRTAESNGDTAALLHPLAACESHIHTGFFRGCSAYLDDPRDMMDRNALKDPKGTALDPARVGFFNWRFIFQNNVAVDPPVSPVLDAMGFVYRLDR